MDSNDKNHDLSDADIAEFENAINQPETEANAKLRWTCLVCGEHDFELISVIGEGNLFWLPYRIRWLENKMANIVGVKTMQSYRCRRCDYVMMFARKHK